MEVCDQKYKYAGVRQFWDAWKMNADQHRRDPQNCDEWVLFTDVDEATFIRDFYDSPDDTIQKSCNSYDRISRLLLVKMPPSPAHETAARVFERHLTKILIPMGLDSKLKYIGTVGCHGIDGVKQPDGQYRPSRLPRGYPRDWPTVAVEVALCESERKLMQDVRYWLGQTHHAVQLLFMIKINRRAPEVTIEKWGQRSNHSSTGPHRLQFTIIRKNAKGDIIIRGDPVIIDFEKLFLRQPDAPREKDVQLGAEFLRELAISIWQFQGFHPEEDEDEEEEVEAEETNM